MKQPIPRNGTEPLKVGDRVQIVPEWQDPGDDRYARFIIEAPPNTYLRWVEDKFNPTRQLIEVPFTHTTADGQQATGFIDHLILTPTGPVILDHKIFPGPKAMWEQTALSYSGQLHLYQQVVSAAYPDQPVAECWIHLVSSGVAVRVAVERPCPRFRC